MEIEDAKVLFSIIVPMYNVEKYISFTINRVLEQSYHNFQLILIDDGSEDNTLTICNKYLLYDSRIKLIKEKHGGQSRARNIGVKYSIGKYITFLDADDYWTIDHLKNLSSYLNNCDMCIANNHINVNRNQEINVELFPFFDQINDIPSNEKKKLIFNSKHNIPGATVLTTYKRDFLEKYHLKFNEKYLCSEDLDFFMQAINKTDHIRFYNEKFYYYRIDNLNSTVYTMNSKKMYHRLQVYKKWYDYYWKSSENYRTEILNKISKECELAARDILYKISWDKDKDNLVDFLLKMNYIYKVPHFYKIKCYLIAFLIKPLWKIICSIKHKYIDNMK